MSNEGEELRKRFDRLKREQGISRAAFAKTHQIKGGDAMIYQHINGMKPISLEAGIAYAAAFGCSLKDISPRLADQAQTISEKLEPNISYGLTLYPDKRGIPIISWVQAGTWREIVDSFPLGGADDYILAHNSHGPHTFAVRIVGNSMEPEFREHDIVVIDPDVMPNPGDYVVARNHEEAATFKKYRPRGIVDGQEVFELVPLNEDYAVMRSNEQPIQIIGTMVEHTRFRRS